MAFSFLILAYFKIVLCLVSSLTVSNFCWVSLNQLLLYWIQIQNNTGVAYADELTFISYIISEYQLLCNQNNNLLLLKVTMMAKSAKCVYKAMKRFKNTQQWKITNPYKISLFSFWCWSHHEYPADQIYFECKWKRWIQSKHFKFLGRWIPAYLHDKDIKAKIKKSNLNDMGIVDSCLVN